MKNQLMLRAANNRGTSTKAALLHWLPSASAMARHKVMSDRPVSIISQSVEVQHICAEVHFLIGLRLTLLWIEIRKARLWCLRLTLE